MKIVYFSNNFLRFIRKHIHIFQKYIFKGKITNKYEK